MAGQNTAAVLPFGKKPGLDFGAALAATKKADSDTPKKGKMPVIADAPEEVKAAVDQYQEAAAQKKQAEGVMDVCGPVILDHARARMDADGFAGRFSGSYAIVGHTTTAKVVSQNKYSLSADDEGQLAEILGEQFPNMIQKKFTVALKAEVFENPELQAALMEAIGDRFPEFFETKVSMGVCEGFNKEVYRVLSPESLENLRVFAKQYKPSIR